jgi:hypothetical protein
MHCKPMLPFVFAPLVLQALARPQDNGSGQGKFIYMLSNEKENAVVALPIGKDGLLGGAGKLTATGGAGMTGVDANKLPAVPDALFSQSSLTIAGNV